MIEAVLRGTQVTTSWNKVSEAAGYGWRERHRPLSAPNAWSKWNPQSLSVDTTSLVSPVRAGRVYEFQVKAFSTESVSDSDWTPSVSVIVPSASRLSSAAAFVEGRPLDTPDTVAPPAPVITATASVTVSGRIDLSWTAVSGATLYTYRYRVPVTRRTGRPYNPNPWNIVTAGPSVTSAQLSLVTGNSYEFQVKVRTTIDSVWSNRVHERALVPIPAIPTGLSAASSETVHGQIDLKWNAVPSAATYEYRYKSGTLQFVTVQAGNALSAVFAGTVGTVYEFEIRATNTTGSSDWSNTVSHTAEVAFPAIPSVSAEINPETALQVDISWAAVPGAISYDWRRRVGTGAWTEGNTTSTTLQYSGTDGTEYEFQVRSRNSRGPSAYSNGVTVTASSLLLPTPVTTVVQSPRRASVSFNVGGVPYNLGGRIFGDVDVTWSSTYTAEGRWRKQGDTVWQTDFARSSSNPGMVGRRFLQHVEPGNKYEIDVRDTGLVNTHRRYSLWARNVFTAAIPAVEGPLRLHVLENRQDRSDANERYIHVEWEPVFDGPNPNIHLMSFDIEATNTVAAPGESLSPKQTFSPNNGISTLTPFDRRLVSTNVGYLFTLHPNSTWEVRVRAFQGTDYGPWSPPVTVVVPATANAPAS